MLTSTSMIRTNRTLILLFVVALVYLLSSRSTVEDSELHPHSPGKSSDELVFVDPEGATMSVDNHAAAEPKFCQYDECLKGRWVPRDPPFRNLEEFQEVFAKRGASKWSRCKVVEDKTRSEEETKRLEEKRLVDIMNWVWKPERGEQIPWDPMDFVVRLLKTPGGIVFMGDSLSQGHEHAFSSYLQEADIKFDMNPSHLPHDSGIRSHILRPNHPVTLELQRRAGVPASRLKYPIYSIVEEHLMVHQEELRELVGQYGAKPGWAWHLDSMKRADDYLAFFRWMTETRKGEETTVTRDTILVMNTGAHWSRGTLYMLPELATTKLERDRLTALYTTLVQTLFKKFSTYSRLTIFYRATNPGHPSCHRHDAPYPSATEAWADNTRERFLELTDAEAADERQIKVRRRWDWDLFQTHSLIWKKEIEVVMKERKALEERRERLKVKGAADVPLGPKWMFVDFYEMSLQRPDAHSAPGRDCLHWCMPAVYNEWSRHIYHLVYLETERESQS